MLWRATGRLDWQGQRLRKKLGVGPASGSYGLGNKEVGIVTSVSLSLWPFKSFSSLQRKSYAFSNPSFFFFFLIWLIWTRLAYLIELYLLLPSKYSN